MKASHVLFLSFCFIPFKLMGAALNDRACADTLVIAIHQLVTAAPEDRDRFSRFRDSTGLLSPLHCHGLQGQPTMFFTYAKGREQVAFPYDLASPTLKHDIRQFVERGDGQVLVAQMAALLNKNPSQTTRENEEDEDEENSEPQKHRMLHFHKKTSNKQPSSTKELRKKLAQAALDDSVDGQKRQLDMALANYYLSSDWLVLEAFCQKRGLEIKRGLHLKVHAQRVLINPTKEPLKRVVIDLIRDPTDKKAFSIAMVGDAEPLYAAMAKTSGAQ